MADYSVALQAQTPNMLGAMGNIVNAAQAIQSFQTGQIQQQREHSRALVRLTNELLGPRPQEDH